METPRARTNKMAVAHDLSSFALQLAKDPEQKLKIAETCKVIDSIKAAACHIRYLRDSQVQSDSQYGATEMDAWLQDQKRYTAVIFVEETFCAVKYLLSRIVMVDDDLAQDVVLWYKAFLKVVETMIPSEVLLKKKAEQLVAYKDVHKVVVCEARVKSMS